MSWQWIVGIVGVVAAIFGVKFISGGGGWPPWKRTKKRIKEEKKKVEEKREAEDEKIESDRADDHDACRFDD